MVRTVRITVQVIKEGEDKEVEVREEEIEEEEVDKGVRINVGRGVMIRRPEAV